MDPDTERVIRLVAEVVRAIRVGGNHISRALVLIELHGAGDAGWQLGPLANHLHQDKSAVRRWIGELIRLGYVDRQGHRYRLTDSGRAYLNERVTNWLKACEPETRQALFRITRRGQS